jgi:hypothetical protein
VSINNFRRVFIAFTPAISHVASQTNIFVRHGTPGTSVADTDSSIRIRIRNFEDQKREHPTLQKIEFTTFFSILWVIFDLLDPDPIRIHSGYGSATLPGTGSFCHIPPHKWLCFKTDLIVHFKEP